MSYREAYGRARMHLERAKVPVLILSIRGEPNRYMVLSEPLWLDQPPGVRPQYRVRVRLTP